MQGFPGGEPFGRDEIITWDVEVLVPAALEDSIHEGNAADVKAEIIVEGANGPTTPATDELLTDRGILIVPDILANAGGVTVSYFEWVQNIQQFRWDEEEINERLGKRMRRAYKAVRTVAVARRPVSREIRFWCPVRLYPYAYLAPVPPLAALRQLVRPSGR